MSETRKQCAAMVRGEGQWGSFHKHPCRATAKHTEDGQDWCGIHLPSKRRARYAKMTKMVDAKVVAFRKEMEVKQRGEALISAVLRWDEDGNAKPLQSAIVAYRKALADAEA